MSDFLRQSFCLLVQGHRCCTGLLYQGCILLGVIIELFDREDDLLDPRGLLRGRTRYIAKVPLDKLGVYQLILMSFRSIFSVLKPKGIRETCEDWTPGKIGNTYCIKK